MMVDLSEFYNDVCCKKRFYLPVIFFALVAYSFSIYNRTVSIDGLLGDLYVGDKGMSMLAGRWGMVVWCKLLGIMGYDPFIDRFLSLFFLCIAAVLLCYVLYLIDRRTEILPYTIVASIFITYPLINEIWEYVIADYIVGGNLCLVTMAAIIIKKSLSSTISIKRLFIACILMLLPMSSYETAVFYYISLVEVIIFYEELIQVEPSFHIKDWIKKNLFYFLPLVGAFIARFVISFIINSICDLDYDGGGDTKIIWYYYDFVPTLKGLIVGNILHYTIYGLVYLPITVFFIALVFFFIKSLLLRGKRRVLLFLGVIVVVSLFSLAILQGDLLMYRHAQTITLFVSFSAYLVCVSMKTEWRKCLCYVLLFSLCWYQAVYMNKLLSLNNLRSDNELAVIRQIGNRIVSEFDDKPIAVVSSYQVGEWIRRQITVDESTWNGRLFYLIHDWLRMRFEEPCKYVRTNCNSASFEQIQLKYLFNYCGYDIDIIPEVLSIRNRKNLKPYVIYEKRDYLLLHLGGKFYEFN